MIRIIKLVLGCLTVSLTMIVGAFVLPFVVLFEKEREHMYQTPFDCKYWPWENSFWE